MKIRFLVAQQLGLTLRHVWTARCAALIFAALGLGASSLMAQSNAIAIGGFKAHPTRILAKFKDSALAEASTNSLRQLGSKAHRRFKFAPELIVLEESDAETVAGASASDEPARLQRLLNRIGRLKKSKLFEYVEPDYIHQIQVTPTDQAFVSGLLWGLRNVGQDGGKPGADIAATNAWEITTGLPNVIVAVTDTGIRYTHRDLTNQMWHNVGETGFDGQGQNKETNGIDDDSNGYVDDVFGVNSVVGSGNPFDNNGHGTHVAGTIGADANDGNPMVGVAWNVQLMACKCFDAQGFGFTSSEIEAINYAVTNGARIINASWGGFAYSSALFDAINRARDRGVLFVAAAGNAGLDNDRYPFYPANYPLDNVISVAALDRNDHLASFSQYGATMVDLGAPGVSIYSCFNGSDTDYRLLDGTSMATPHVSGVAALILSQYPGADLAELRGRILRGTVPIPALSGRTVTGGRLNAYNALTIPGSGVLQLSVNPPSGSTLIAFTTQPITVKVTDLFTVNDATVTAMVNGELLAFTDIGQGVHTADLSVPDSTTSPVTMIVTATAPGKIDATAVVYYNIVPQPLNDMFAAATKVPAGGTLYQANNLGATLEPGEPAHASVPTASSSLWWAWTPATSTNVLIDTTGSMIDTVLAAYTGNALGNLVEVAATNDVGQVRQAYLRFNAQAGTAYRIAVASAGTNQGSILLRVAPGGQLDTTPPQIFCTNLSGLTFSTNVISVGGTALDPAPNATGLGEVLLSVNGSIPYSATGTTNWIAPVVLQSGLNVIKATVVDRAANFSSQVTVQANYFVDDPVNDLFANAIEIELTDDVEGFFFGFNENATKEVGEPNHGGNVGGKSVWWKWTSPSSGDGVLTMRTVGSSFDTLLGLYTGTNVSHLTPIASNDDASEGADGGYSQLSQAVRSNQIYYFAVDGYAGVSGLVNLYCSFGRAAVYRLAVSNAVGGSVQVTYPNPSGGIQVMPSSSGDFASDTAVDLVAVPDPNYEFDFWSGDVSSLENPLTVVVTSDMTLTAHFRPIPFTDGFESGGLTNLNWTTTGNAPWLVQTNGVSAGTFAAKSGVIADSQSSSLILAGTFAPGDGSFDYRVSSETNWDFLEFYVDNALVQRWSGEVGWFNYVFPLTAGSHELKWRYVKDANLGTGLDAAFLDNVNLPMVELKLREFPKGTFFVDLYSPTNQQVVVQTSTNLVHWQNIATNVPTDVFMRILDPASQTQRARFYRAVIPQPPR